MKRQTDKLLNREIKYISSFFPYDIKRFHNEDLIYMQAVLMAGGEENKDPGTGLSSRLVDLMAGLELLSMGTAFHDFNIDGTDMVREKTPSADRGYTLDLLFGDIFYSRAVIYLLKFGDHRVFDSILEALKKLHESRLDLHLAVREVLSPGKDFSSIDRNKDLLAGANRLLYISFIIGLRLWDRKKMLEDASLLKAIDSLLAYKTYRELLTYAISLHPSSPSYGLQNYLEDRCGEEAGELNGLISDLQEEDAKITINMILESLDKGQSPVS